MSSFVHFAVVSLAIYTVLLKLGDFLIRAGQGKERCSPIPWCQISNRAVVHQLPPFCLLYHKETRGNVCERCPRTTTHVGMQVPGRFAEGFGQVPTKSYVQTSARARESGTDVT